MFNSGISSLSALKTIAPIKKKYKKIVIFVDGGIEMGTDIIKYLCNGADIVGIGRPVIYGLIIGGKNGVKKIFEILKNELITSMINGGFSNIKEFTVKRVFNEK